MVKSSGSLLFIYLTLALVLLLLLASFSTNSPHRGGHRRLKLRSNFPSSFSNPPSSASSDHAAFTFDPVIAEMEGRFEDHQWEQEHFHLDQHAREDLTDWEEYMKAEDYINDEERFNITDRIIQLFPKIDTNPTYGQVSAQELAMWHLEQGLKQTMHRTEREMELYDENRDGFISFKEYKPPSWADGSSEDKFGWWREEHFNAADVDGNGLLNKTEFNDFLHPSDSSNPKIKKWLCKETIREKDTDKDGKLSFHEFLNGLYDTIKDHNEVHDSREAHAKQLFVQLDTDNNGFISEDEIVAVITKLHPSEEHYAKEHADYIISVADTDKNGFLSLKEMVEHQYAFYGSVYREDDDFDDYHDEFR